MNNLNTHTRDFGDGRTWRKARASGDQGGSCLYATLDEDRVGVRDGKAGPSGTVLWFSRTAWTLFLDDVKTGRVPY